MILDLIMIVLLILFAIVGYNRGLIDMIIGLLSSICALILAFIIYPVVNMLLKLTPLYSYIQAAIEERIGSIQFGTGLQTQGKAISEGLSWLPNAISQGLIQNNNSEVYKSLGVTNIADYISVSIANIIIAMLALVITWFLLNVVLTGGFKLAGRVVASLPVIAALNQFGGLIVGIIKGLFILSIIGLIIPLIAAMPNYDLVIQHIEASYLTKWLYENNLIIMILNQVIY